MPHRTGRPALAVTLAAALLASNGPLSTARADDDADRHTAAAAVLDTLHSTDMAGTIVPSILAQVRLTLTHNDPTLSRQFDEIEPRLRADAEAKRPELVGKLVDIYARTFTLAELNDMLAYFKTPVGQRIIQTQGTINRDMLAAARDWGNGIGKAMMGTAATELQGKPAAP